MTTQLSTRKPIDGLTPDDLAAFPIWEFASDEEEVEGQDETWVRPVPATVIPAEACSLSVAADFRTPSGATFPGIVGVTTEGGVELSYGAILANSKYVPVGIGSSVDRDGVAASLELKPAEAFPLSFVLRVLIDGEATPRLGAFG